MAQILTGNTRTEAVKTVSSHYFFNVGGIWDGAQISLEWSEDGTTWFPLKDDSDSDILRTNDSNGTITTGKNGFLSVVASGGGASLFLQVSLIPV